MASDGKHLCKAAKAAKAALSRLPSIQGGLVVVPSCHVETDYYILG